MRIRFAKALIVAVSMLAGSGASAATGKSAWDDYGKRVKASQEVPTLGPDLMGDLVSHSNGALSFSMTDVSIPGNSALPMSVARKYSVRDMRYRVTDGMMKDWDLDLPEISATFVTEWHTQNPYGTGVINRNRCSQPGRPPLPSGQDGLTWEDFWNGISINIPGVTSGELLTRNAANSNKPSGAYTWMTNDQVHVSCLTTIKNGTGEGFLAITPDGTKYWFDWMARHQEPALIRGTYFWAYSGPDIYWSHNLPVYRYRLLVTRIEDRFGNAIEYTYSNTSSQPARLTRIKDATGGEGRQIDITYSGDAIQRIDDGTRRWTYAYGSAPGSRGTLTSVNQGTPTLPNQRTWTIAFSQFTSAEIVVDPVAVGGEEIRSCLYLQSPTNYAATPVGTITHPSGAVGTYTVSIVEHSRSNVPVACQNVRTPVGMPPGTSNDQNDDSNPWPFSYHAFSLKTKTISGNAMTPATWNYTYASDQTAFLVKDEDDDHINWSNPVCARSTILECMRPICTDESGCAGTARTTVVGPDNTWTRYTYGNSYRYDEGKLRKVETGSSSSNIVRTATHQYDLNPTHFDWASGMQLNGASFQDERLRPLLRTDILQQGVTFTNQNTLDAVWARPTSTTRSSTLGNSRTDTTTYADNQTKWVVGQVASVTNTNLNRVISKTDYDTGTALPTISYWPHVPGTANPLPMQTLAYNANGTLATVKDGNNNVTMLSDWYRGVPKKIKYADLTEHNALVSPVGWITRVTDQTSNATNYSYDDLGRLASITYPTGDSVAWNTTTLSFAKTTAIELGFPAGTWRQQIQTGNGIKRTYFDAMWRPRMSHEYDSANQTATQRFNAWSYDASGRLIFTAYPRATATSLASFTLGVDTVYDSLGRVTAETQDSELAAPNNLLVTLTEYLNDFKTKVTQPRGNATTTSYMAWDEPDTSMPTKIEAPEGVTTNITRDALGMPTVVSRPGTWSGQTITVVRSYFYDSLRRLVRTNVPEEGVTGYRYDNAGNLTQTIDCPLNSDTSCNGVVAADRIRRTYDAMNRLKTIRYPDGIGDADYGYAADGLLATLNVANPASGGINWTYTYNNRRLLTKENLFFYGDYPTDYTYNANGHLAGAGLTHSWVDYAPNALGQPTQATPYATGVQYHPNGAVKQFTYGNGIVHTMTQNIRQLPATSRDASGSTVVMDITTTFGKNGNVATLQDPTHAGHNRSMLYDNLNRLVNVTAGAHWTSASYTYDVLDNLRTSQLVKGSGTDTYTYAYEPAKNRPTSIAKTGIAAWTYLVDTRGNVTEDGRRKYTWTRGDRLASIRNMAGDVLESYLYDGHGRRVVTWRADGTSAVPVYGLDGKVRMTADNRKGGLTSHIYLGDDNIADVFRRWSDGQMTTTYLHTDALGSPIARTNAAGAVIGRSVYAPYGQVVDNPADPNDNEVEGIGYTGHLYDAVTDLVYMQQRYYDPAIGRFISADPMASDMQNGWNFSRYNYAANNPYRFADPDGRAATEAGAAIGCALTGPACPAGAAAGGVLGFVIDVAVISTAAVLLAAPVMMANESNPPANEEEAGERIKGLVGDEPTTEGVKGLEEKGWEWKGKPGEPTGSNKGAFVNPETGEQVHNDLDSHVSGSDRGPHVTYTDSDGNRWDYFPETDTTVRQ